MLSFFRYLKPYWAQAILLVVAIGLQVWGTLALPALMADIVNDSIATKNTSQIWNIGLMMFGFTIMAAVCACLSSFFSARIGAALSRDIRQDVYRKILSLSISEIDNFSTASLITRTTNDIAQVQQTLIMSLSMLLRAPIMAIGAIIGAIDTAPDMTWIIVLAVGVMLVCIITVMAIVIPKFELFQKLIDKITLITRENLTGIRVVRAFNNQKLEYKKFKKANDEITDVNIFINNLMSLEAPLMTLVFNGTSILCVWIGISLLEKDISYLGDMMAFMQYALQVIMAFLVLTIFFVMLPRANVSARRIHEVLDIKPTIHWRKKTEGTPSLTPSVEFKDVTFSYPSAEAPVLNNISFAAKAGETTAFIGSTGSGKTTLINLVPRFHDATSGEVIIDGLNVKKYSKDDLMQKIGYVPQRGLLFSGDINSNITFGNPSANASSVVKAASVSQAKEFIEKLPEKYGSSIAQGGHNVSGGQKQRLSIARAIAKEPKIYIFDDSFSALDMKTDKKLRKELKTITEKSVVLVVAQRISTIKDAEQIIVLDQGKIVGKGNHLELLNKCKVYREINKSQLSEEEYTAEINIAKKLKTGVK